MQNDESTQQTTESESSQQQGQIIKPASGDKPEKVVLHPRQKKEKPPKKILHAS